MDSEIVRLGNSDIVLVLEMLNSCNSFKYADTDTLESLQSYLTQQSLIIGIFVEEELAGYAILSLRSEDSLDELFEKYNVITDRAWGHVGILQNCVIRDIYRGQGFQLELLKKREQVIRNFGYKAIFTSVHMENKYSINNLIKSGYRQIGRHISQNEWIMFGKVLSGEDDFRTKY
ncbi:GNAT family N-acetyltransferase [Paenibacillus lutimineralis]|uniref:GNAT family N-acetyltransferase n=1 Tax=Paenibacillus lutimineralis TaxID=2707005 RepID=A0A3Q9IBR9_9BACL|nr:GNAT family N-acetyltransferase [Paenibacillus lutimineralis]AZS14675.1 GNAT family N-acetyltransferase [Paenibacillus lutimineralis]